MRRQRRLPDNTWRHDSIPDAMLHAGLKGKVMEAGGHRLLKIYGRLDCPSGKKMKDENRVFFAHENDAWDQDFRPCRNCMPDEYARWAARHPEKTSKARRAHRPKKNR